MNLKNPRLRALSALLLCIASSANADAAAIDSAAVIDWTTFKVSLSDTTGTGVPQLVWVEQYDQVVAGDAMNAVLDWHTGVVARTAVDPSVPTEGFSAVTSAESLVTRGAGTDQTRALSDFTSTSALRHGQFVVSGAGSITFSVNYTHAVSADSSAGYSVDLSTGLFLTSAENDNFVNSDLQVAARTLPLGYASLPFSEAGVLSVSLSFADGWTGVLDATSQLQFNPPGLNPVPLPASAGLLSVSVLGLLLVFRSRPVLPVRRCLACM